MQEDYWPMGEHPQQAKMQMPVLSQCPWFSFPFSLLLNLKKRIKKKKKKTRDGKRRGQIRRETDRQTEGGRNPSTLARSSFILMSTSLQRQVAGKYHEGAFEGLSGALGNYPGLVFSLGRGKKKSSTRSFFFS